MAEQLEHLIERIHTETIEKSEVEAAKIVAQAKEKAAAILREGEAAAKARLEKADRDAQVYVERSRRTLEQSARDLLITVGQGVENILQDIIGDVTTRALDISTVQQMLLEVVKAYTATEGHEQRIQVLIPEKDQHALIAFFADQYRKKLVQGVDLHADRNVMQGFRVCVVGGNVQHEFTREAIAEALANFLRPHLAEIVHRAARETEVRE